MSEIFNMWRLESYSLRAVRVDVSAADAALASKQETDINPGMSKIV